MSIQDTIRNWRTFFDEDDEDSFDDLLDDISFQADHLDDQLDDALGNMQMALDALANGNEVRAKNILEHALGNIKPAPAVPEKVVKTWWVGGRAEMRGEAVADARGGALRPRAKSSSE